MHTKVNMFICDVLFISRYTCFNFGTVLPSNTRSQIGDRGQFCHSAEMATLHFFKFSQPPKSFYFFKKYYYNLSIFFIIHVFVSMYNLVFFPAKADMNNRISI